MAAKTSTPRKGPRASSTGAGKPAWQRLTKRQRADFLAKVAEGQDRAQATAEVGAPSGSFRALCRHDPRFEADYLKAKNEGREPIAEGLRNVLLLRALDRETPSSRFLHNALMLFDDEYRAVFSRQRVELTGRDGGPLSHEHQLIDPTKLTDDQLSQLDELLRVASPEA